MVTVTTAMLSTHVVKERSERARETPLDAPYGKVTSEKGSVNPERSGQDKRGEILLDEQIGEGEKIKGKMEPERTTLQPSPASSGVEAPGQPRLSCRET